MHPLETGYRCIVKHIKRLTEPFLYQSISVKNHCKFYFFTADSLKITGHTVTVMFRTT